jgi:hypothetical protein
MFRSFWREPYSLAPGKRTVTSALRAVGLEEERQFCRYHRVLNRAAWSGKETARVLLGLLVDALVPHGPLILGIDETLERRRGKKIGAKGVYRDPLLSSCERFVKTSGLRWICVVLLAEVLGGLLGFGPCRVSLSVGPLRALHQREQGKRHKKLTDWAWQLLLLVRRWYPQREIVAVADRTYASLKLLERCQGLRNPIS